MCTFLSSVKITTGRLFKDKQSFSFVPFNCKSYDAGVTSKNEDNVYCQKAVPVLAYDLPLTLF